jgi:hypothetical protein
MSYDPFNLNHRQALATALINMLAQCEFEEIHLPGTVERTFARPVNDRIRVVVYTSIVGDAVRGKDYDAIRVTSLYTTQRPALKGKEEGIIKDRRVHRSGQIEGKGGIIDRVHGRMRNVWKLSSPPQCTCSSCGAPKFISKKGNAVCAEKCWLTDEEVLRPAPRRGRGRGRRRSGGYRRASYR